MDNTKIEWDKDIAKAVTQYEQAGVARQSIFHAIQRYQNAPRSYATFWKVYKETLESANAENVKKIGSKVVEQAIQGDFKSQELYLRSKGGWSPQSTEVNVEVDQDADEGALEKLMGLLGKR